MLSFRGCSPRAHLHPAMGPRAVNRGWATLELSPHRLLEAKFFIFTYWLFSLEAV